MQWLVVLFILAPSNWHPIYLSTGRIIIEANRSWNVSLRIFYDDLEDAIQNENGKRPTLTNATLMVYQEQILSYLQEHIIIKDNDGNNLHYLISNLEMKGDVVIIFCEGKKPWSSSMHTITNDLLTEIFGSQKNVMTITYMDKTETLYFTKHQRQHSTVI